MTKVEENYKNSEIIFKSGIAFAISESTSDVVGRIAKIELSIEHPEQMLGISRVESVILYNEKNEALYNDQEIVNNNEYPSDQELICEIAKHYGVSKDIIETI